MLVALLGMLVMACASGPPASHYVELLDELRIPAGWELAYVGVREPGSDFISCETFLSGDCPSVHHYYLVAGHPADAYPATKQMAIGGGFKIDEEYRPGCVDARPAPGRIECRLVAVRGTDLLYVNLFASGLDVEELGIAKEGHFVIEIRAHHNPEIGGIQ